MRPRICRRIAFDPQTTVFKPAGIPMCEIESVELAPDELEAMRLADVEGLYHATAGEQMGISRQTFARLLKQAHLKVTGALISGKGIVLKRPERSVEG
jgi:predicted DNA-binding protein (UPF0251 family)